MREQLMRSPILLGLIGFAIVMGALLGGFALGGLLHSWLTPDYDFMYAVWLWVGAMPFWWLCVRYANAPRFRLPMLVYVALLPWVLAMGAIDSLFEPSNPWRWIIFAAGTLLFGSLARPVFIFEQIPDSQLSSGPMSTNE
jgi:hypothetical protein